jgi:SAM-dependent methyltransferase
VVHEFCVSISDICSWRKFMSEHPLLLDQEYIKRIVDHGGEQGIFSAFLGRVEPEEIHVLGPNYRETFNARGLNPRCRAILELITSEPWSQNPLTARIYAAEAISHFALAMRARFPRFIGSEYVGDERAREALYPIEFQDLTRLTLISGVFDCVITNECLEHVPNVDQCLREMHRVLRPGGVVLSTFPFCFRRETLMKARMVNGHIEYLTEPEYHGNPIEPEEGSLVFQIPGWDILDTARNVGFRQTEMVFLSSLERGITATDVAGVLVFRCYK